MLSLHLGDESAGGCALAGLGLLEIFRESGIAAFEDLVAAHYFPQGGAFLPGRL